MKNLKYFILPLILLASPSFADTHNHNHSHASGNMAITSTPKDGESLNKSPSSIKVQYAHPMALQSVEIINENNSQINIGFKSSTTAQANYNIAIPTLPKGNYTVKLYSTASNHNMTNEFCFTVN